jgi:hypothetical protein
LHHAFSWLWKSSCQLIHKIFFWLLLHDKLSTRGVLRRRNMTLEDYGCAVWGTGIEESVEHLFLKCSFVVQCFKLRAFPVTGAFQNKIASSFFHGDYNSDAGVYGVPVMPLFFRKKTKLFKMLKTASNFISLQFYIDQNQSMSKP